MKKAEKRFMNRLLAAFLVAAPAWVAAAPALRADSKVAVPLPDLASISDRDAERLLLVGHNPGLERLVALLSSGQSGDYRGMPPAAVAVLSLPAEAEIEPGIATLSTFWWP